MIVTYEVGGEWKTMHVQGFSVQDAISLIPSHGRLAWVQYD